MPELDDVLIARPDADDHLGFQPFGNIYHRYPYKKGLVFVRVIWRNWVLHKHARIAYLSNGKRAFERHAFNIRGLDAAILEYVDRIILEGMQEEFRGKTILQSIESNATSPGNGFYSVIAGGTITGAVYAAIGKAPNGEQVIETMSSGIGDAIELKCLCPSDVIDFAVDRPNDLLQATVPTYVQGLKKVPLVESGWLVHKKENGNFTKRSCVAKGPLSYHVR